MAEVPAPARRPVRFSSFELDLQSGELRKGDVLVPLQEQSLKVLMELAARPGELVTREQLRQRLWPDGTFVDYEHGLNAVINRLRETLGDSADSPRFIRTEPRRGYRFIAPVDGGAAETRNEQPGTRSVAGKGTRAGWTTRRRTWIVVTTAVAIVTAIVLVASIALFRRAPPAGSAPPKLVPLTRLAGSEEWPAFAPDGEQVAFAWSGEKYDSTDVYVTVVGSTSVRRLTTDAAEDYAPSWSPDGRRIAFLRRTGDAARIHVVSALGGPDLQVSDFPVGATMPHSLAAWHVTWSPDGRYVAAGRDPSSAAGRSAGIFLIPIDSGAARALTRPEPPTFHFSPVFSPDGRRVAYASCDSPGLDASTLSPENCRIESLDVDDRLTPSGAGRTLTRHPVWPAGMAWSRDGKSILFVGPGSTSVNLVRLWIDGTRDPEPLELAGGDAIHPATVASRDRLVFSRYDWEDHLYRFVRGKPIEPVAASSSFESDPHFSPDGRRIAFSSGRSGHIAIWVALADGSEPRQLTSNRWLWQGSPNWSPDGRTIAFDAYDPDGHVHVWTIPAAGGPARRITSATGDQTAPTWSRDGKWIYYSESRAGGRDIWRVPEAGGPSEQITHTGAGFLAYETADGTSLLYQPKFGDTPLFLMPLHGGGAPRRVVDCVRPAAFAPTGFTITYVACDSGTSPSLRSIDFNSGRQRLLGTLEHFPPHLMHVNLAVSPDGKTILFRGLTRRGADLMLIENFR